MLYLNKNQNNVLKIRLSDSYINNYSGNYIFNFKNIQSDDVHLFTLSDTSLLKNIYSEFTILVTQVEQLGLGQHILTVFDENDININIYTDTVTVTNDEVDEDIYYSGVTNYVNVHLSSIIEQLNDIQNEIGSIADLQSLSGLTSLTGLTDLNNQIISISTAISTEYLSRTSGDTSLSTAISSANSTRSSADTSLSTAISTETSTRGTADTSLSTAISTANSVRGSADTSLSTSLSSRISTETSLSTAVSTETSERTFVDTSLSTTISTEILTRSSADTSLSTTISTEISTRDSSDTSLSTAISTNSQKYIYKGQVYNLNVADGKTYYFGSQSSAGSSNSDSNKIFFMTAGTITKIKIYWYAGSTVGTDEQINMYLTVDDVDTLIGTIGDTNRAKNFERTDLNIPVVYGSYFNGKIVCPTWATNPSAVSITLMLLVE